MHDPDYSDNRDLADSVNWIPDFGQPIVVLRALLVAIAIAVLLTLLRNGLRGFEYNLFGPLALLSVWVCCLSALGLQLLRHYGAGFPLWLSVALALLWMLLSAAICGTAPFWLGVSSLLITNGQPIDMALEAMLITLLVGAAVLRAFYTHREIQNQQKRLLQAKFDALQARIRPHFLFNSLNTVAELIAIDPVRAENAILDLSDLFRATLTDQDPVEVWRELALCEKYLNVEKLRMGDRLRWQFNVSDSARDWRLPALSLQPLLENAVLHGLQSLQEGGLIELSLDVVDSKLQLNLKNPVSDVKRPSGRGTGTALKNIRARLEAFSQKPVVFEASESADQYLVTMILAREPQKGS